VLLFQDAEVGGVSLSFCSCFFSNRLSASFLTTVSSGRTHKIVHIFNFDMLAHDKGYVTATMDAHAISTWRSCHYSTWWSCH